MGISRRAFLTGSASGAAVLLLAACTTDGPSPAPTTPRSTPTPTPTPAATPSAGPTPSAFRRSGWADDPFARGSGSYLTTSSSDADRAALRRPVDDRLFFAGEAVASTAPGTLGGARASGFDVAQAVAAVAERGERIAVVGAGMAGATAARSLADLGYDVVVVEARDRVGGRVASYTGGDWPFPLQMGAASLDGEAATALVAALALGRVDTVRLGDALEVRSSGGQATTLGGVPERSFASAAGWADDQAASVTVAQAVTGAGAGPEQQSLEPDASGVSDAARLQFVIDEALPVRWGAGPDDLAERQDPGDVAELVAADPGSLFPLGEPFVTGDLSAFVEAQLDDLDVLPGSTVARIQYGDQGVGLRLATGESLSVDRVVVTLPLGVLKEGTTEFAPELPTAHAAAIETLGVAQQEVLWLRFDERAWSTEATVLTTLDGSSGYRVFVNLMPSTGEPVLVALAGGDDAVASLELGDDEAVADALAGLAPYFDLVPEAVPEGTSAPDTGADPSQAPAG
ncbi:FAD-dependent oxidoreductase [Frigoribacterium sp. PvP032]|uniref:flavin monoamine oxidase family protein n=1 Tax=Frigoribacterium sp. PvP032 TaxID=2806589 RepID=UPI001AEA1FC9|nr:FAD-dependent oxidoreductase [Frigoribacterium sp. PvP032]MBP1189985.1 monoamine oxidase [Frigoribacterium sp. PvP032]